MPGKEKIFAIIYFHSNLVKENELARSYSQATRYLIETDPILNKIILMRNADDPKVKSYIANNSEGINGKAPGFLVKYMNDDMLKVFSPEGCPKVLFYDIGFANEIFKKAYYIYTYLENQKLVPYIGNKIIPKIKVSIPPLETVDFADICYSLRHPAVNISKEFENSSSDDSSEDDSD